MHVQILHCKLKNYIKTNFSSVKDLVITLFLNIVVSIMQKSHSASIYIVLIKYLAFCKSMQINLSYQCSCLLTFKFFVIYSCFWCMTVWYSHAIVILWTNVVRSFLLCIGTPSFMPELSTFLNKASLVNWTSGCRHTHTWFCCTVYAFCMIPNY